MVDSKLVRQESKGVIIELYQYLEIQTSTSIDPDGAYFPNICSAKLLTDIGGLSRCIGGVARALSGYPNPTKESPTETSSQSFTMVIPSIDINMFTAD